MVLLVSLDRADEVGTSSGINQQKTGQLMKVDEYCAP